MRQVDVGVVGVALVDGGAHRRVGLVGLPVGDAACGSQRSVQFGGGGGAGPDADPELLSLLVGSGDALGERTGEGFGIASAGEAGEADIPAILHQGCGIRRRHHLGTEPLVPNPI